MRIAVYLPLVMPLLAALVARPIADRLHPQAAVWLATGAAVVLSAAGLAALGLLSAAGLAQLPELAAMKGYSLRLLRDHDPAGLVVGVLSALLLTAAVARTVFVAWRRLVALAGAADRAAQLEGSSEVVVLDGGSCDAYAVPGLPGRIVVSRSMLEALQPPERAVLIAHERAHLRRGHVAFVSLVRCAAAANPFLTPLQRVVEYSVERWADEVAASVTGDRRRTAVAIAKAALASTVSSGTPLAALGITGARSAARDGGPVPRRVAAMLAPPVRSRPAAALLSLAGLVVTVACAAEGARDLHALFSMVGLLH